MAKLLEILTAQKRLWQQQREIGQLQEELTQLRAQNESMREGMRRCVTCEYRVDYKARQDSAMSATEREQPPAPLQTDTDHIPD